MRTTKKILLIITVMLTLILISCADSGGDNADTDGINESRNTEGEENTAEEPGKELPDNLPRADFDGYDFMIYTRDNVQKDFFIEDEIGEILNDAVYLRNKKIEDRFNINFKYTIYPNGDGDATLTKLVRAGDDAFDIASVSGVSVFTLAYYDFLVDWHEKMPYVDLDALWWPDDINKNISPFGKLFGATGDISYTYLDFMSCLLFNKELFLNYGLDYPYAAVSDGSWTLDKFISVVKQGAADLDGDGVVSPKADGYGLEIVNYWHFPNDVFYSAGDRAISLDAGGIPELTVYNQRTVDIFEKFFDMMGSGAAHINELGNSQNIFRDGRALFFNGMLTNIVSYRALETEFGILPMPKYDENTPKYHTLVKAITSMVAVPVTAGNTERTSIIVEALAAEGYRSVLPAYFELNLKTKHARDDESAAMLDYIRDGAICDYGAFDSTIMGTLNNLGAILAQSNESFTTTYDKNRGWIEINIEKLKDKYGF